jgi:tetratricopeptide (TPR) repeat protein
MRTVLIKYILPISLLMLAIVDEARAQHASDVQKLNVEGDHFRALATYELLPSKKVVPEAKIAAAKSAWALGLNRQAADSFDAILRDSQLSPDTRARLILSRAVLEYQEERYQEGCLFAEKAVSLLGEPSPLRGRAFLLWGQSFVRMRAYGNAQEKFSRAMVEVQGGDKAEAYFNLGLVEMKLGKYAEAQRHLEAIPMDHERTATAIRLLAGLSLETKQIDRAKFWIEKGKHEYPEVFVDSWGDYGLLQVALAKGDIESARRIEEYSKKQYAPSDSWLVLMQAALEQAEWQRLDQPTVG